MAYGHYKLAAEEAVLAACPHAAVARLPLMYGRPMAGGHNFFVAMLERLARGETINVFHDQYRSPGLVDNMAAAVLELAHTDFAGRIHIAGATRCSREQLARAACEAAGLNGALLQSVSMYALDLPAPRPRDVSLVISRAQQLLKTPLLGLEAGIRQLFD